MRTGTPQSLRVRFAIASLLWIGIGTVLAGFVISGLYRRHVTHTFTSDLTNHLDELLSLTEIGPSGVPVLVRPLSDPRFGETRSGFYWQVEQNRHAVLRSASLAGHHLRAAPAKAIEAPVWTRDHDEDLLRIDRASTNGLVFSITASGRTLTREINAFRVDLAASLALFAALMLIGTTLQVRYGLLPTRRLTGWIEELRRGDRSRLPNAVPSEFAGIVRHLNELLEAQAALVSRARVEAGNLSHNLRTPLALIAGEAEQLTFAGQDESARFILEQCQRMQRQIDYQMKRAAAAGGRGAGRVADLSAFLSPILDAMRRLHADRNLDIAADIPPALGVPCDPGDLAEMLSNLIDNACKWAGTEVRVEAAHTGGATVIRIADDGPGIPDFERDRVLGIGVRLDESKPGSGLGLSVSRDLIQLYDGTIALQSAASGHGLLVILTIPD